MSIETTFAMIKPNAIKKNIIGSIIQKFEEKNLQLIGSKLTHLDQNICEEFYGEHRARPFFGELVEFMTSGPVLLMALRGENAVATAREIMGATNPAEAAEGTIRKLWGDSIGENTIHGSDSLESAKRELALLFSDSELISC